MRGGINKNFAEILLLANRCGIGNIQSNWKYINADYNRLLIETGEKRKSQQRTAKRAENSHKHAHAAILLTDAFKLQISGYAIKPSMPTVTVRQQHRNNMGANSPPVYWKRAMYSVCGIFRSPGEWDTRNASSATTWIQLNAQLLTASMTYKYRC